jgi:prolycopene isomerase
MKEFDCIVIGAGMAGLTAALKLCAAGKKVLVLERQPVAGGVGTSFKRKGFTFESSLHYVDALSPGEEVREFLDQYGVSQRIEYIEMKEFGRILYPGLDWVVKNDFDSLKLKLKDEFSQDKEGIDEFFREADKFYRQLDAFSDSKLPLWLKLLISPIVFPSIIKTSCLTLEQFIPKKIKDKRARAVIGTLWSFIGQPPSEVSAFYFLIVLKGCWGAKTAYVKGGFNRLFSAMTERIREYGSEIRFNTTVTQIVTEKGKIVKGVRTAKGEEFRAKAVISNANCIDTLTKLIDCDKLKVEYEKNLSCLQKSLSAITVYLGLDVPSSAIGMRQSLLSASTTYDHDEAFKTCSSEDYSRCNLAVVDHSQLDPQLAPQGKSTLCIMTLTDYATWEGLAPEDYLKKKKAAAEAIVTNLEKYLPGLKSHIEFQEAATPRTMERYALLPEGSVYGFAETVPQSSINRLPQETKVKGLFLAGAWTKPGCGVHGCFVSGFDAADLVLRQLR